MQAKVFDPFTEDAVNAWLATTPVKVIYKAEVFDSAVDGHERQVALVFYSEEREMGREAARTNGMESKPLFGLLHPIFHPELELEHAPADIRRARRASALDPS